MTRRMYDSTNPADIPRGTAVVGGYVNGIFGPAHAAFGVAGWDAAGWARHAGAAHVEISVYPTGEGNCGDVEPGCIWPPAEAVDYVRHCRADGREPSLYCDLNNWPAIRQAIQAAGLVEPHYWVALWDEVESIPWPDAVGKQYDHPPHSGGHYDLSLVVDHWPGVDSMTYTPPANDSQALEQTFNMIKWGAAESGGDPAADSYLKQQIAAGGLGGFTAADRALLLAVRDAVVSWDDMANPQLPLIHTSPLDAKLAGLQTATQAAADTVAAVRNQLGVLGALISQLGAGGGGAGGGGATLAQIQTLTDPLAAQLSRIETGLRSA